MIVPVPRRLPRWLVTRPRTRAKTPRVSFRSTGHRRIQTLQTIGLFRRDDEVSNFPDAHRTQALVQALDVAVGAGHAVPVLITKKFQLLSLPHVSSRKWNHLDVA